MKGKTKDAPCGKKTNSFWLLYFNYEKHFYFLFTIKSPN